MGEGPSAEKQNNNVEDVWLTTLMGTDRMCFL